MIPNTSKYAPPVSQYIPLISAIPPIALSRRLGVRPGWPKAGALSHRVDRTAVEVGLDQFLIWLFTLPATWPFMPAKGVALIAESVMQRASEDQDVEERLEEERLGLKMSREMGAITEEELETRMAEIDRKIEEIESPSK